MDEYFEYSPPQYADAGTLSLYQLHSSQLSG